MDAVSASSFKTFCVDSEGLKARENDGYWTSVPPVWVEGGYIQTCRAVADEWAELSCLKEEDFPRRNRSETAASCSEAYGRDPALFEFYREEMEQQTAWSVKEMKQALQWMFNCIGVIPKKDCDNPPVGEYREIE